VALVRHPGTAAFEKSRLSHLKGLDGSVHLDSAIAGAADQSANWGIVYFWGEAVRLSSTQPESKPLKKTWTGLLHAVVHEGMDTNGILKAANTTTGQ
jgi:hypothetical protein